MASTFLIHLLADSLAESSSRARARLERMDKTALHSLADEQLRLARESHAGRSAEALYGGHDKVLRHALIALRSGAELSEHNSPGEATIIVLRGRIRLRSGDDAQEGAEGDFLVIPPARHSAEALEDAVIILSVAKAEASA